MPISLFTSFNFHSCLESVKTIAENQLRDFLITVNAAQPWTEFSNNENQ